MDGSGRVYVADSGNDRVQVFDADGAFLGNLGSQGGEAGQFMFPHGIAVDGSGRVYVADTSNHRVQVFSVAEGPGPEPQSQPLSRGGALELQCLSMDLEIGGALLPCGR